MADTYESSYKAITDVLEARDLARGNRGSRNGDSKWPAWIQTVAAVGVLIVSLALAYAALDKRIALLEQKIDFLVQQVGKR